MNISDSITWILWKYYALKKALKIGQFNMGANDERRDVNSIRQDRGSRFDNHYVSRVGHLSIYNLW